MRVGRRGRKSKGCTRGGGFCTAPGPNRRSQHAAWTAIDVPMQRGGQDDTKILVSMTKNEGIRFYENELEALYLGSDRSGGHRDRRRGTTGGGPGPRPGSFE